MNHAKPPLIILGERRASGLLPCLPNVSCRWQPWCCPVTTTYKEPEINFATKPERIPVATVHMNPTNARVEGQWQTSFRNASKPGTKTMTKTCRCRGGSPSVVTQEVEGSADLSSDGDNESRLEELADEVLDRIREAFAFVRPNVTAQGTFSFQKNGAWETIKGIYTIMRFGVIRVKSKLQVVIAYTWLGARRQRSFTITQTLILPVDKVNWVW